MATTAFRRMIEEHAVTISVVCPTYNSASFIEPTIRSVLDQTTPPFELIISDDGSTDRTREMVEQWAKGASIPIVFLPNVHGGPGAARNAGIGAARGEWIAFLDSDDRWHPEKIRLVSRAVTEYPEANFFCHDVYHRLHDGRELQLNLPGRYQNMILARQLFRNCPFVTSAVVCRKDLLTKNGMFNEKLMSAQDYELWLRLTPFLRVFFIDEVLGWYNDRPGNVSSQKRWQHLRNELIGLTINRHNTTLCWFLIGVFRHIGAFCKNSLHRFISRNC